MRGSTAVSFAGRQRVIESGMRVLDMPRLFLGATLDVVSGLERYVLCGKSKQGQTGEDAQELGSTDKRGASGVVGWVDVSGELIRLGVLLQLHARERAGAISALETTRRIAIWRWRQVLT